MPRGLCCVAPPPTARGVAENAINMISNISKHIYIYIYIYIERERERDTYAHI